MKKIYLLAVMTAVGTMSFAQSSQTLLKKATAHKKESAQQDVSEKAPGASIWTDTFDDPTNWVINGDGAQGEWVIGNVADLQNSPLYFAPIESTTVADGFAFFEGVGFLVNGTVQPQNAWIEMADPIDLSAEQYVNFSFEQAYRAFSNICYVEVSTDGGATWNSSIVNADVQANTGTFADVTETFLVNNSSTVKFRFRWEASNAGYAWQVDDVEITTLPDNDMKVTNTYYGSVGLHYYQIPEAQIAPIDMSVNVENTGINTQTGVYLSADETVVGTFSDVSPTASIPFEGTDSLAINSTFTPPGVGNYSIEFNLMNDDVDDVPANNQIASYDFEVGPFIYARDNGTVDGSISGSYYQAEPILEPGTLYDIFTAADLQGIDVTFGASQVDGVEVYGRVYEATPTEYVLISETDIYTSTAADAGSEVTLLFPASVPLEAGKTYVASVGAFTSEMIVAAAGESEPGTSITYGDLGSGDGWYIEPNTPMIRMNFSTTASVENNETSNLNVSQNFPNPFSNETTVEYSLENASEVSYTVVDLAGNTILDVNEGNVSAGKHAITIDGSSLANGVYYFIMNAGGAQTTHKMIVNK
jgi:hypothetical protein